MFTRILSTQGLRQLCPDFSKIAFLFLLVFAGFGAPQVQGQIVIVIEDDIFASNSENSQQESMLDSKPNINWQVYHCSQIDIFPNPFDSQLNIKVSEQENLNHLELVNENGAVVWEQNIYSVPDKFIIQSLEPGTYYLHLAISGGNYTETLIYQP